MAAPEEAVISWRSPSRPFKKRSKEFFTTVGSLIFLVAVVLVLIKEFWAILAMFAVALVAYALATTPPDEVEHKIGENGLESIGHDYKWDQLYEFWFSEKWGQHLLFISTRLKFPRRLIILLGEEDKVRIKEALKKHLSFREKPEKNFMDDAAKWLAINVPLEKS